MTNVAWTPLDVTFFGPKNKTISLWGQINEELSLSVISQIMELDSFKNDQPITILMNTEGGSQMDAYAIHDAILSITTPVTVIVTGLCASAGLTILNAADYKLATKNAIFFYHETIMDSQKPISSFKNAQGIYNAYEMLNKRYKETFRDASKISDRDWAEHFENSTVKYLNADQALQYAIIDDIIKYKNKAININEYRSIYGI